MKYPASILIVTLLLSACSPAEREEILERHPNGEKKVVAVYKGSGSNEVMLTRMTYSTLGELFLVEDLVTGETKDWSDLAPSLSEEQLFERLQGQWFCETQDSGGDLKKSEVILFKDRIIDATATTTDDRFIDEIKSTNSYTAELVPVRYPLFREVLDNTKGDQKVPEKSVPNLEYFLVFGFNPNEELLIYQSWHIDEVTPLHTKYVDGVCYRDRAVALANAEANFKIIESARAAAIVEQLDTLEELGMEERFPKWFEENFGFWKREAEKRGPDRAP